MPSMLTILFAPLDAVGHVMACIGIAEILKERGHRCVFITTPPWRGKLEKHGFEEELVITPNNGCENAALFWADVFYRMGIFSAIPIVEKTLLMNKEMFRVFHEKAIDCDALQTEIVERVKPDVIIIDHLIWIPSLMECGIPWVWSISCNPLIMDYAVEDDRLPPSALGLTTTSHQELWPELKVRKNLALRESWIAYNNWLISNGFGSLPENKYIKPSPYLNIYMYPKELDYTDIRELSSDWCQFDYFKRSGKEEPFELPKKLKDLSGKLIYLSMGSMGGINLDLMRKLVSMLSKTKHRYIVSKGPLSDEYELGDNMWGESTVPQLKILPIVDLVITHGGNNTVTETLYFGKAMVVMPIFVDQFDNAQRIQDKGYGLRLDPFDLQEGQLSDSIERLLNDPNVAQNLKTISKRIQSDNSIDKIVSLIEGLKK